MNIFNQTIKKIISLVTTVCLLLSFVFGEAVSSVVQNNREDKIIQEQLELPVIPANLGKVTESYGVQGNNKGVQGAGCMVQGKINGLQPATSLPLPSTLHPAPRTPLVINIQDLHCQSEVQKNIAGILDCLDKKYHISKIYMEGASGEVNTSWMDLLGKDKETTADLMLELGRLTGVEYYSAISKSHCPVLGLENREIHSENIVRLENILNKKDEALKVVENLELELSDILKPYLNSKTRRLLKWSQLHKKGKLKTARYYRKLNFLADSVGIEKNNYRNINKFLELEKLSKQLQYRKISRELHQYVTCLKNTVSYKDFEILARGTENFSIIDISAFDSIERKYNISVLKNFPALNIFAQYMPLSRDLNPIQLIDEENCLFRELSTRLSEDQSERDAVFLFDFMNLLKDYYNNKISAGGYDYYTRKLGEFKFLWAKYCGYGSDVIPEISNPYFRRDESRGFYYSGYPIETLGYDKLAKKNSNYNDARNDINKLESYNNLFSQYYAANIERNRWFFENIKEAVQSSKLKVRSKGSLDALNPEPSTLNATISDLLAKSEIIVTVTGGFHTSGLTKLLKENGISYLVITPNVTTDPKYAEQVYQSIIGEQSRLISKSKPRCPVTPECFYRESRFKIADTSGFPIWALGNDKRNISLSSLGYIPIDDFKAGIPIENIAWSQASMRMIQAFHKNLNAEEIKRAGEERLKTFIPAFNSAYGKEYGFISGETTCEIKELKENSFIFNFTIKKDGEIQEYSYIYDETGKHGILKAYEPPQMSYPNDSIGYPDLKRHEPLDSRFGHSGMTSFGTSVVKNLFYTILFYYTMVILPVAASQGEHTSWLGYILPVLFIPAIIATRVAQVFPDRKYDEFKNKVIDYYRIRKELITAVKEGDTDAYEKAYNDFFRNLKQIELYVIPVKAGINEKSGFPIKAGMTAEKIITEAFEDVSKAGLLDAYALVPDKIGDIDASIGSPDEILSFLGEKFTPEMEDRKQEVKEDILWAFSDKERSHVEASVNDIVSNHIKNFSASQFLMSPETFRDYKKSMDAQSLINGFMWRHNKNYGFIDVITKDIVLHSINDKNTFEGYCAHEIVHAISDKLNLPMSIEILTRAVTVIYIWQSFLNKEDENVPEDTKEFIDNMSPFLEAGREWYENPENKDKTPSLGELTGIVHSVILNKWQEFGFESYSQARMAIANGAINPDSMQKMIGSVIGAILILSANNNKREALKKAFNWPSEELYDVVKNIPRFVSNHRRRKEILQKNQEYLKLQFPELTLVEGESEDPALSNFSKDDNTITLPPEILDHPDEMVIKAIIEEQVWLLQNSSRLEVESPFNVDPYFMVLFNALELCRTRSIALSVIPVKTGIQQESGFPIGSGMTTEIPKHFQALNDYLYPNPHNKSYQKMMAEKSLFVQFIEGALYETRHKNDPRLTDENDPRIINKMVIEALNNTREIREELGKTMDTPRAYNILKNQLWTEIEKLVKESEEQYKENELKKRIAESADGQPSPDEAGLIDALSKLKLLKDINNQISCPCSGPNGDQARNQINKSIKNQTTKTMSLAVSSTSDKIKSLSSGLIDISTLTNKMIDDSQKIGKGAGGIASKTGRKPLTDKDKKNIEGMLKTAGKLKKETEKLKAQIEDVDKNAGQIDNNSKILDGKVEKSVDNASKKTGNMLQTAKDIDLKADDLIQKIKNMKAAKETTTDKGIAAGNVQKGAEDIEKSAGELNNLIEALKDDLSKIDKDLSLLKQQIESGDELPKDSGDSETNIPNDTDSTPTDGDSDDSIVDDVVPSLEELEENGIEDSKFTFTDISNEEAAASPEELKEAKEYVDKYKPSADTFRDELEVAMQKTLADEDVSGQPKGRVKVQNIKPEDIVSGKIYTGHGLPGEIAHDLIFVIDDSGSLGSLDNENDPITHVLNTLTTMLLGSRNIKNGNIRIGVIIYKNETGKMIIPLQPVSNISDLQIFRLKKELSQPTGDTPEIKALENAGRKIMELDTTNRETLKTIVHICDGTSPNSKEDINELYRELFSVQNFRAKIINLVVNPKTIKPQLEDKYLPDEKTINMITDEGLQPATIRIYDSAGFDDKIRPMIIDVFKTPRLVAMGIGNLKELVKEAALLAGRKSPFGQFLSSIRNIAVKFISVLRGENGEYLQEAEDIAPGTDVYIVSQAIQSILKANPLIDKNCKVKLKVSNSSYAIGLDKAGFATMNFDENKNTLEFIVHREYLKGIFNEAHESYLQQKKAIKGNAGEELAVDEFLLNRICSMLVEKEFNEQSFVYYATLRPSVIPVKTGIHKESGFPIESGMTTIQNMYRDFNFTEADWNECQKDPDNAYQIFHRLTETKYQELFLIANKILKYQNTLRYIKKDDGNVYLQIKTPDTPTPKEFKIYEEKSELGIKLYTYDIKKKDWILFNPQKNNEIILLPGTIKYSIKNDDDKLQDYDFSPSDIDTLIKMMEIHTNADPKNSNLAVHGPKGTGKNSDVYVMLALLCEPMYYIGAHSNITKDDLLQRTILKTGKILAKLTKADTGEEFTVEMSGWGTEKLPSGLILAMKNGGTFVLDEADKVRRQSVLTSMNIILNRLGEEISKDFRCIVILNDADGDVLGEDVRNSVPDFASRFRWIKKGYKDAESEIRNIMNTVFPNETGKKNERAKRIAVSIVKIANKIRQAKVNNSLDKEFSLRSCLRMARYYKKYPHEWQYLREIFDLAYDTKKLSDERQSFIDEILLPLIKDSKKNGIKFPETLKINDKFEFNEQNGVVYCTLGCDFGGKVGKQEIKLKTGWTPKQLKDGTIDKQLNKHWHIEENMMLFWRKMHSIELGNNKAINGPAGSGKTELEIYLERNVLGLNPGYINFDLETEGGDIYGEWLWDMNTGYYFKPNIIVECMREGRPVIIDEAGKPRLKTALSALNSLEHGYAVLPGETIVPVKKGFRYTLIYTDNEEITGEAADRCDKYYQPAIGLKGTKDILKKFVEMKGWKDKNINDSFIDALAEYHVNLIELANKRQLTRPPSMRALEGIIEIVIEHPERYADIFSCYKEGLILTSDAQIELARIESFKTADKSADESANTNPSLQETAISLWVEYVSESMGHKLPADVCKNLARLKINIDKRTNPGLVKSFNIPDNEKLPVRKLPQGQSEEQFLQEKFEEIVRKVAINNGSLLWRKDKNGETILYSVIDDIADKLLLSDGHKKIIHNFCYGSESFKNELDIQTKVNELIVTQKLINSKPAEALKDSIPILENIFKSVTSVIPEWFNRVSSFETLVDSLFTKPYFSNLKANANLAAEKIEEAFKIAESPGNKGDSLNDIEKKLNNLKTESYTDMSSLQKEIDTIKKVAKLPMPKIEVETSKTTSSGGISDTDLKRLLEAIQWPEDDAMTPEKQARMLIAVTLIFQAEISEEQNKNIRTLVNFKEGDYFEINRKMNPKDAAWYCLWRLVLINRKLNGLLVEISRGYEFNEEMLGDIKTVLSYFADLGLSYLDWSQYSAASLFVAKQNGQWWETNKSYCMNNFGVSIRTSSDDLFRECMRNYKVDNAWDFIETTPRSIACLSVVNIDKIPDYKKSKFKIRTGDIIKDFTFLSKNVSESEKEINPMDMILAVIEIADNKTLDKNEIDSLYGTLIVPSDTEWVDEWHIALSAAAALLVANGKSPISMGNRERAWEIIEVLLERSASSSWEIKEYEAKISRVLLRICDSKTVREKDMKEIERLLETDKNGFKPLKPAIRSLTGIDNKQAKLKKFWKAIYSSRELSDSFFGSEIWKAIEKDNLLETMLPQENESLKYALILDDKEYGELLKSIKWPANEEERMNLIRSAAVLISAKPSDNPELQEIELNINKYDIKPGKYSVKKGLFYLLLSLMQEYPNESLAGVLLVELLRGEKIDKEEFKYAYGILKSLENEYYTEIKLDRLNQTQKKELKPLMLYLAAALYCSKLSSYQKTKELTLGGNKLEKAILTLLFDVAGAMNNKDAMQLLKYMTNNSHENRANILKTCWGILSGEARTEAEIKNAIIVYAGAMSTEDERKQLVDILGKDKGMYAKRMLSAVEALDISSDIARMETLSKKQITKAANIIKTDADDISKIAVTCNILSANKSSPNIKPARLKAWEYLWGFLNQETGDEELKNAVSFLLIKLSRSGILEKDELESLYSSLPNIKEDSIAGFTVRMIYNTSTSDMNIKNNIKNFQNIWFWMLSISGVNSTCRFIGDFVCSSMKADQNDADKSAITEHPFDILRTVIKKEVETLYGAEFVQKIGNWAAGKIAGDNPDSGSSSYLLQTDKEVLKTLIDEINDTKTEPQKVLMDIAIIVNSNLKDVLSEQMVVRIPNDSNIIMSLPVSEVCWFKLYELCLDSRSSEEGYWTEAALLLVEMSRNKKLIGSQKKFLTNEFNHSEGRYKKLACAIILVSENENDKKAARDELWKHPIPGFTEYVYRDMVLDEVEIQFLKDKFWELTNNKKILEALPYVVALAWARTEDGERITLLKEGIVENDFYEFFKGNYLRTSENTQSVIECLIDRYRDKDLSPGLDEFKKLDIVSNLQKANLGILTAGRIPEDKGDEKSFPRIDTAYKIGTTLNNVGVETLAHQSNIDILCHALSGRSIKKDNSDPISFRGTVVDFKGFTFDEDRQAAIGLSVDLTQGPLENIAAFENKHIQTVLKNYKHSDFLSVLTKRLHWTKMASSKGYEGVNTVSKEMIPVEDDAGGFTFIPGLPFEQLLEKLGILEKIKELPDSPDKDSLWKLAGDGDVKSAVTLCNSYSQRYKKIVIPNHPSDVIPERPNLESKETLNDTEFEFILNQLKSDSSFSQAVACIILSGVVLTETQKNEKIKQIRLVRDSQTGRIIPVSDIISIEEAVNKLIKEYEDKKDPFYLSLQDLTPHAPHGNDIMELMKEIVEAYRDFINGLVVPEDKDSEDKTNPLLKLTCNMFLPISVMSYFMFGDSFITALISLVALILTFIVGVQFIEPVSYKSFINVFKSFIKVVSGNGLDESSPYIVVPYQPNMTGFKYAGRVAVSIDGIKRLVNVMFKNARTKYIAIEDTGICFDGQEMKIVIPESPSNVIPECQNRESIVVEDFKSGYPIEPLGYDKTPIITSPPVRHSGRDWYDKLLAASAVAVSNELEENHNFKITVMGRLALIMGIFSNYNYSPYTIIHGTKLTTKILKAA